MQVPIYDQTMAPSGGINAAASPDDFGAQVGQATQSIGAAGEGASQQMFQVQQDQATVWAYDAAGKAADKLSTDFSTHVNSLDPNDPQFSDHVSNLASGLSDQMDQTRQSLLDSAPTAAAARTLAKVWSMQSRSIMQRGVEEQSRLSAAYTAKQSSDMLSASTASVAADPSNDSFDKQMAVATNYFHDLTTVDPVTKMKDLDTYTKQLSYTQVQTAASTNPNAFLAMFGAQGGRTTPGGAIKGAVPGGPGYTMPENMGADTVRPYTAKQIQDLTNQVRQPSQFDGLINTAASKYGIDPQDLKMRLAAESGLQAGAVGPQTPNGQAVGIAQITKDNAAKAGIDPMNPPQAIDWAAQQLSQYSKAAGGDASKVDMTYYGGQDQSMWGPNTKQYAANLGAVRQALGNTAAPGADVPQVEPMSEQAVAAASPQLSGWKNLDWKQQVSLVRQAEADVGTKLASNRGQTEMALRDATSSYLAGKDYPGADNGQFSLQALTQQFGAVEGQNKFNGLSYSKTVGDFMQHLATMPAAQRNSFLQTQAPQGGDGFATQEPMYHAAFEAASRVATAQKEDFAQYAVNNKIAGAGPIDWSDDDTIRASLGQRQAMVAAGNRDYGVDAQMLTKGEVKSLSDRFDKSTPDQQLNMLQLMRQSTKGNDGAFTGMVNQIAPNNPMLAQAADISLRPGTVQLDGGVAQDGTTVGKYIVEGASILQGKSLGDKDDVAHPLKLDFKQLGDAFNSQVGDAFQSNNAAFSAEMKGRMLQAVQNYMAADVFHRGLDAKSMDYEGGVKNALTAVTGGVTSVSGGKVFMPWGMSEDKFGSLWNPVASSALAAAGQTGRHADPAVYKPVNLGEGQYGFMVGTQLLRGKNGKTVVADFNAPQGSSVAAPAPAVAPAAAPAGAPSPVGPQVNNNDVTPIAGPI